MASAARSWAQQAAVCRGLGASPQVEPLERELESVEPGLYPEESAWVSSVIHSPEEHLILVPAGLVVSAQRWAQWALPPQAPAARGARLLLQEWEPPAIRKREQAWVPVGRLAQPAPPRAEWAVTAVTRRTGRPRPGQPIPPGTSPGCSFPRWHISLSSVTSALSWTPSASPFPLSPSSA